MPNLLNSPQLSHLRNPLRNKKQQGIGQSLTEKRHSSEMTTVSEEINEHEEMKEFIPPIEKKIYMQPPRFADGGKAPEEEIGSGSGEGEMTDDEREQTVLEGSGEPREEKTTKKATSTSENNINIDHTGDHSGEEPFETASCESFFSHKKKGIHFSFDDDETCCCCD